MAKTETGLSVATGTVTDSSQTGATGAEEMPATVATPATWARGNQTVMKGPSQSR